MTPSPEGWEHAGPAPEQPTVQGRDPHRAQADHVAPGYSTMWRLNVDVAKLTKPAQPPTTVAVFGVAAVVLGRWIDGAPGLVLIALGTTSLASAVILVFLIAFVPRVRQGLLDDRHWLRARKADRRDAHRQTEAVQQREPLPTSTALAATWNRQRIATYEATKGLFLLHETRPSSEPGQVVDIALWIHQHGEGPLTEGTARCVEYYPGPLFSDHPIVETDATTGFAFTLSAYAPLLCLARVELADGTTIVLQRYLDFSTDVS